MKTLVPLSNEVAATAPPRAMQPYVPKPPELRQITGMIMQRALLGLGVASLVFLVMMAVAINIPPKYTATGAILIEPKRENLARTEAPQQGMQPDTSAVDTQVELLRSHALAESVVRRLRLDQDPEFNPKARKGPSPVSPNAETVSTVADRVAARTNIRRAGLTYVVDVAFASRSAAKAVMITNGIMSAYLQRQLDDKISAVSRANHELGSSLEAMRQEAEGAMARVQEYKNQHGLFSAEGATMAEQEVSTLNQQIAQAKADTAEKQARLAAAVSQVHKGGGGADVGAALGSETVRELRKKEAETSVHLAQLQADFKPEYPEVKRTQAQLDDIRVQIQLEINRILSSLKAEASAASQRQGSLLGSRGTAQVGLAANGQAQVGLLALQQRADSAKQIYEAYLDRAKQVAAEGGLQQTDATIASPASATNRPSSPNLPLIAIGAALFSLLVGGMSMLLAELWKRSLRSGQDVERELGVPFAGILPEYASVAGKNRKRGVGAPAESLITNPLSSFAESLRNLRAFLFFSGNTAPARLIALTSAVPKEGKSLTSLCLAQAMALSGSKVVVVDCDLRMRGLTKLVGESTTGIVQVVEGSAGLDETLVVDPRTGLWILPAAGGQKIPHDLFSSPACDALLRRLAERFDHVILDTPPILGVADARILAAKVDQVLYVVHWNKTPLRTAQSAVEILRACGADVAGALLSRVDIKAQSRYGFKDDSDYFHEYRNYYVTAA